MDFKLELIPVPVSDVERAKAFYTEQAGFAVDNDVTVREGLRFIQLTPPGSGCSIAIGEGTTENADQRTPRSLARPRSRRHQ